MNSDGANDMNLAALLRAGADDELQPDQKAHLDAHLRDHPRDTDRIEFERQLKEACGRVMGPISAPPALRERLIASLDRIAQDNSPRQEASSTAPAPESVRLAQGVESLSEQTRRQSFWNRMTPAVRALAAAILLLVGGLFLLQVVNVGSGNLSLAQAHMSEIATFVGDEHDRCVIDPSRAAKFNISELDAAPALLEEIVGKSISPANLAFGGLAFRDGGRCHVPGKGDSVHLRFDVVDQPGETVSLFIQRVADESDELFESGKSYELQSDNQGRAVFGWAADGLNYFLVAKDEALCESYSIERGLTPNAG